MFLDLSETLGEVTAIWIFLGPRCITDQLANIRYKDKITEHAHNDDKLREELIL